jgi:hypothetical protein
MVADPKALQYIFQGYNFPKRADFRQTIRLLTGTGLLYADGKQKLEREIFTPCFFFREKEKHTRLLPSESLRSFFHGFFR